MFDTAPTEPHPISLQQHPNFVAALRACGQSPLVLGSADPLVVLRRRFPGGFRMAMLTRFDAPDPADFLAQLARSELGRFTPIILSPDAPAPELAGLGAVPLMTPATLAELDLRPPEELRRAALHKKWRNRLVHAEKNPLRITRQNMPRNPKHWLLRADAIQQRRRGYRGWPLNLTLAYAAENPGQAKLFTAFEGKKVAAAMLFLRHGACATYHIGHTTPRGRQLSAHNLLLWQATCWLAAKGHTRLELGLINTVHTPGLARFKLGSGARPRRLGGTWGWWPPLGRSFSLLAALDRHVM